MHLFYIPDISGNLVHLDETESAHASRVLRLKTGDPVALVDGHGGWFDGTIDTSHPKKCSIRITAEKRESSNPDRWLHIAVAPTKNSDRIEWFLEKATEIGISIFTPLLCRFSERKNINNGRLEKIAVAAMKQSLKAWLPQLHPLTPFQEFVRLPFPGKKLIAHCYDGAKPHLKELVSPGEPILVLIGPEGDFSPEEVQLAMENGFLEISLGNSRLRTETAAMMACMTVALANG